MKRSLIALLVCGSLGFAQEGRGRPEQGAGPAVGAVAPDFTLKALEKDGQGREVEVKLSRFKGDKPVLLILGSYT